MKKMYLLIFLIILVVFVFAGCLSFSGSLSTSTTDPDESSFVNSESVGNNDFVNTTVEDILGNEDVSSNEIVTSGNETPTSGNENPTNSQNPGNNDTPVQNNPVPASNEYDILRSGAFHMVGSMIDASGTESDMEIAITPDTVFMLAPFGGATMGMLISDKSVYMIYQEKKAYLELSESLMKMAGMDIDELLTADSVNFSSYGALSEANSVTQEACNGRNCTVYHFKLENGETRVYMDGSELIRLASYNSSGKFLTSTDIETITGTVPADKSAPPANYKEYKGLTGMMSFMTLLEDVM